MAQALNPDNVLVGTANGPGIYLAPVGTAFPTDVKTAPAAAWVALGYASEDGVKIGQSTTSESIKSWQSKTPVRTTVTEREFTLDFTLLEFSKANMALYFGAKFDATGDQQSFSFDVRSDAPSYTYALLIDQKDGDQVTRLCVPRVSLTDAGDLEIMQGGAMGLPLTFAAQDDSGVLMKVIRGSVAAPAGAEK